MLGLQTITGQPNVSLARRPFFVFWFMSQISRSVRLPPPIFWRLTATGVRALTLWTCDHSLTVALEMSKTLLGPIQFLMSCWPCLGKLHPLSNDLPLNDGVFSQSNNVDTRRSLKASPMHVMQLEFPRPSPLHCRYPNTFSNNSWMILRSFSLLVLFGFLWDAHTLSLKGHF